jgi:GDPmannose 4,6-dehydratase
MAAAARSEGRFVACAIPFNHESERRSEDFVFAKVCNSAARIALGQQKVLRLGSVTQRRDWGYAPEFVQAMAWMLDVERPCELVLGTGQSHSVEELVFTACAVAQLDSARCVVTGSSEETFGESGPSVLQADPALAWSELGWRPQTLFDQLVNKLTLAALDRFRSA